MKILESVRGLAFLGSFAQAGAFAAACAEHTCGVLFRSVARAGREADLEVCRQALEQLWEPQPADPVKVAELRRRLGGFPEIQQDGEHEGIDSVADLGARVLHAGMGLLIRESPQGAAQPSSFARGFAVELGRRCGVDLLAREVEAQDRNVAEVLSWDRDDVSAEALSSLRDSAAELGRVYLSHAVAVHDDDDESGGGVSRTRNRVVAVQDRGDVADARERSRLGIVGRISSGDEAGRYVRVDLLQDLAESPEERAEPGGGVMIRVADDPGMERNCLGEWVEDWAAVEETFRKRGRHVDWGSRG